MNVHVIPRYRDRLNDGRALFLNGEMVQDVSSHPALAGAVQAI